jgi:nucleotide-binding universal stress UspA family protein
MKILPAVDGSKSSLKAVEKLDLAKIPYEARILVGSVAETIVKHARSQNNSRRETTRP